MKSFKLNFKVKIKVKRRGTTKVPEDVGLDQSLLAQNVAQAKVQSDKK